MLRDFTSISPTAKSLLFLKTRADIPFARAAAEIVWGPKFDMARTDSMDTDTLMLLFHFENRYRTVDELAFSCGLTNYLEISSGFSFRGLDFATKEKIRYVDTDLPAIVETKKSILDRLVQGIECPLRGRVTVEPLNAVDGTAIKKALEPFAPDPVCIVNEGLLVYLNHEEKRCLCENIRGGLAAYGGVWITGDIYTRSHDSDTPLRRREETRTFLAEHKTEENKFEDFQTAEAFFRSCGLKVTKRITKTSAPLKAVELLKRAYPGDRTNARLVGKRRSTRETWILETL